jgi:hypothetical protein
MEDVRFLFSKGHYWTTLTIYIDDSLKLTGIPVKAFEKYNLILEK